MGLPSQVHARRLLRSSLLLLAGLVLAAPALAVTLPTVSITDSNGNSWNPVSTNLGCGTADPTTGAFSCSGTRTSILSGDATGVSWNMSLDPDPTVSNTIALTNNTASTQTYIVTVTLPVSAISSPIVIGGSVSGSITDLTGNGATVARPSGYAIYTALIDGSSVATLNPFTSFSVGSFLSGSPPPGSFGTPIPSQLTFLPVNSSIGIQLAFTLTPGDSASFTSVFVAQAPEPGTVLLLLAAAGGVMAARRRMAIAR
jgi:hypothetical protein